MTFVWANANTLIFPSAPIGAITVFGRATPASKFTLDTSGRLRSDGNTVRNPGPVASVAVTLRTAAVAPAGTRAVPATWTSIVCCAPTGPPLARVSSTRSGTTVKSRAFPPGPNQPKTSTITLASALAKIRMRPPAPTLATTAFGEGVPGGKFTLDVPGWGPPSGKIVRYPGPPASTAVTFNATASAESDTSPPVTFTLMELPAV